MSGGYQNPPRPLVLRLRGLGQEDHVDLPPAVLLDPDGLSLSAVRNRTKELVARARTLMLARVQPNHITARRTIQEAVNLVGTRQSLLTSYSLPIVKAAVREQLKKHTRSTYQMLEAYLEPVLQYRCDADMRTLRVREAAKAYQQPHSGKHLAEKIVCLIGVYNPPSGYSISRDAKWQVRGVPPI